MDFGIVCELFWLKTIHKTTSMDYCWMYSVLLSFFSVCHTTPLHVLSLNSILLVCHLWRNSEQSRSLGHPLNVCSQEVVDNKRCIFLLHLFRENSHSCSKCVLFITYLGEYVFFWGGGLSPIDNLYRKKVKLWICYDK